MKPLGDQPFNF